MKLQKLPDGWITLDRFMEGLANMIEKYSSTRIGVVWDDIYEVVIYSMTIIIRTIFAVPIVMFSLVVLISKLIVVTFKKVCGLV